MFRLVLLNLYLVLLLVAITLTSCLPVDVSAPLLRPIDLPVQPQGRTILFPNQIVASSRTYSAVQSWSSALSRHPIHANTSNGQRHLPWHSGPWDRAWQIWNGLAEKFKLVKRGANFNAQESIANHLRPTNWTQKVKDFWRKITFRKLKITSDQVEQIKNKYRPDASAPSRLKQKSKGRFFSAFGSGPRPGQSSANRQRPARSSASI